MKSVRGLATEEHREWLIKALCIAKTIVWPCILKTLKGHV